MTSHERRALTAFVRCVLEPDFLQNKSELAPLFGLERIQKLVHKESPTLSLYDYVWRCVDGNYSSINQLQHINTRIREVLGRDDEP